MKLEAEPQVEKGASCHSESLDMPLDRACHTTSPSSGLQQVPQHDLALSPFGRSTLLFLLPLWQESHEVILLQRCHLNAQIVLSSASLARISFDSFARSRRDGRIFVW